MSAHIRSSTLPLLKYTRTRILQSRHGLYLELRPNGTIQTTTNIKSPFVFLQFLTVGTNMVAIWGVESRLYLAIDEDGTVFTTKAESKECVFKEHVSNEFYSQFETCHKNNDDLVWYLCVNSNGKITAKPCTKEQDKTLDFIVKLPAEQAVFCKQVTANREKQQITSRTKKIVSPVPHENLSKNQRRAHGSTILQRAFSSRSITQQQHQNSEIVRQSSSDSQYSQSERSYSFTDSMEIAGFTSDSSLESFKGVYERNL